MVETNSVDNNLSILYSQNDHPHFLPEIPNHHEKHLNATFQLYHFLPRKAEYATNFFLLQRKLMSILTETGNC